MTKLVFTFDNDQVKLKQNDPPPAKATPPAINQGHLEVHVQSETGQALSGVHVQIIRMRDNVLMFDLTTDNTGKTQRVALPTPVMPSPFGENSVVYYTNYAIYLTLPGYYTTIYDHVSIYDGSTMILYLTLYTAKI